MVALKHNSTNVPISMSHKVHLQDDKSIDSSHDSHRGDNYNDDEDDAWLSNPQWILIALILDHVFTTKTSSQMQCSTIHSIC